MSPRVIPQLVPVSRSYTYGDSQDETATRGGGGLLIGSFPNPWSQHPWLSAAQQLQYLQSVSVSDALNHSESDHRHPDHRLGYVSDIRLEVHETNGRIPAETYSNESMQDRVTDHQSARNHDDDRNVVDGSDEDSNHLRRPSSSSPIFSMDDDSDEIIDASCCSGETAPFVAENDYLSSSKGQDTCRNAEEITRSSPQASGGNRAQHHVGSLSAYSKQSISQCDAVPSRVATRANKCHRELTTRRTSYERRQHSRSPARQISTANVSLTESNISKYSSFPASEPQKIPASVKKSRSETHEQSLPARHGFQHDNMYPTSFSGQSSAPLVSNDEMRRFRSYQPASRYGAGSRVRESNFYSAKSRGELHQDGYEVAIHARTQIRRFHSGVFTPSNPEWHDLVSPIVQARFSLKERERQGILFEFIKGESSYVHSLTAFRDVYFEQLLGDRRTFHGDLPQCIWEFDKSLKNLVRHHEDMLGRLKIVQLDEHPIIRSIAEILLEFFKDNEFCSAFMSYMKAAPVIVDWHRKIRDHNASYMSILDKCIKDASFKKRDIIAFFYLPKERICHLTVLLERMLKKTDEDHQDFTTLPILINNVRELLENAQEGVVRSEKRLELLSIVRQLDFVSGKTASEYGLTDEDRQLLHIGDQFMCEQPSYRFSDYQQNSWKECRIILLDSYLLICTRTRDSTGAERLSVKYNPMSIAFLHLPLYPSVSVTRTKSAGTSRRETVRMYPVRICDGQSELSYTFYSDSDAVRKNWNEALNNAIRGCELRRDVNRPIKTRVLNHPIPKSTNRKAVNNET